jgi:hypothetical protein
MGPGLTYKLKISIIKLYQNETDLPAFTWFPAFVFL